MFVVPRPGRLQTQDVYQDGRHHLFASVGASYLSYIEIASATAATPLECVFVDILYFIKPTY